MKLSINECTKIVQMIIRLSLGTMFLLAGVGKLSNPEAFIQRIDSYSIIPDFFTSTVITLLPIVEFVCGILIIAGFLLRPVIIFCISMSIIFLITHLYDLFTDSYTNCGCFGDIVVLNNISSFNIDAVLLLLCIFLLYLLSCNKEDPTTARCAIDVRKLFGIRHG